MSAVSAAQVRSFVLSYLAESFGAKRLDTNDLSDDFDLLDNGIISSIGLLEMASAVDEEFGIEVDFEALDTEQLTQLGTFSRYVEKHARAAGSES
jgi:acyl carrier protein